MADLRAGEDAGTIAVRENEARVVREVLVVLDERTKSRDRGLPALPRPTEAKYVAWPFDVPFDVVGEECSDSIEIAALEAVVELVNQRTRALRQIMVCHAMPPGSC